MIRIGIDVQATAEGNRTGLYTHLRYLLLELRRSPAYQIWLLAADNGGKRLTLYNAREISKAFDGTPAFVVRPRHRMHRLWHRFSACNQVDVLMHNLHGSLPAATRGANTYVVPDVIPLGFDYGLPNFADAYRPYYEKAVTQGDTVIVWSEHTKQDLMTRVGGDASRIHVCPLAVGPEFVYPVDEARLKLSLKKVGLVKNEYVLMVSTIEKRKNHAVLLRAFHELTRRDPSLPHKIVFIGGKWIGHEEVFELANKLQLGDRFVYPGYVESIADIYAGADAFVFPSLYEGFGLPPLEAMACGLPTLVADTTALPEVVGDAGIRFEPHDEISLADHLQHVLTDRTYHEQLVRRSLEQAAHFTWERTGQCYIKALSAAYEQFCGKH